jgi:hypothetical protein
LPLFVARVATDDKYDAATTYDFAFVADSLNAGFNFHGGTQQQAEAPLPQKRPRMAGNA